MNDRTKALPLGLLGLGIIIVGCSSEVTLLPGLGFGALLVVAAISLSFSETKPSGHDKGSASQVSKREARDPELTHDELVDVVAGLAGSQGRDRYYSQFEVLITSVTYGDYEILVTHTPENGYCAEIRDGTRTPSIWLDNYATTDDALIAARRHVDTLMQQYVTSDRHLAE
jgi:hypothetical protein